MGRRASCWVLRVARSKCRALRRTTVARKDDVAHANPSAAPRHRCRSSHPSCRCRRVRSRSFVIAVLAVLLIAYLHAIRRSKRARGGRRGRHAHHAGAGARPAAAHDAHGRRDRSARLRAHAAKTVISSPTPGRATSLAGRDAGACASLTADNPPSSASGSTSSTRLVEAKDGRAGADRRPPARRREPRRAAARALGCRPGGDGSHSHRGLRRSRAPSASCCHAAMTAAQQLSSRTRT